MDDRCGIDWLLDCKPRPAQIEALARSYTGKKWRNNKNGEIVSPVHLPHSGRPATGWGHFMEMRVGKTPTALNEFMLFKRDYGTSKCFMLSPNRYKYKWGLEAERFGIDVPVFVFESSKKGQFAEFMRTTNEGFVIANYEALIQEDNVKLFAEWIDDKTYFGADESVAMKNKESSFFKRSIVLSKNASVTRPMTGLPTPQGPADLWAQLRFARQIDGFGYHPFKHTFQQMGGFKNKKVLGIKNEEKLHKILDTSCFKARRVDWGTKIDSDYETVSLEMTPPQKKAYKEMDEDFIAWLDSGEAVSAEQVITKRIKMQQISSGFIITEEKEVVPLMSFSKTPKFVDLVDRLNNEVTGKVIVVAHYNATIMNLLEGLKKFKPALICGGQHMKKLGLDAEDEKDRFNGSSNCKVMVAQSQAVKYGHTLMGNKKDPCLSMAFFENNYSLDNRAQTEERPQGEGQAGAIHIWDYFSSPIERQIVKALQTKQDVATAIMGFYGRE